MDYLDVGDYLSDGYGWRRVACAQPRATPQTSNHICLLLLLTTLHPQTLYNAFVQIANCICQNYKMYLSKLI